MILRCVADRSAPLRDVLRRELGLSSTQLRRGRDREAFRINGAPAFLNAPVRPGDTVTALLEEAPPSFPAEDGPLDVLYEDEALLAVDKPAGLPVHPTASRQTGTLANRVAGYYAAAGAPCGVHLATRLDRDTFGVVLLARHAHIHARLCRMQAQGLLRKTYLAAVDGAPPEPSGVADLPVARRGGGSLLREVRPDGQSARSLWRTLGAADGRSLLELQPLTGRTHQLRLHCAALGCPIVGDRDYGGPPFPGGLQLLAHALTLPHPLTGAPLTIRSRQSLGTPELAKFFPKDG